MPALRVITPADIPAAMRLKEAANWNQTATDWENLMRLAPEGCFGIDCDGTLASTATAVRFGRQLAWIGMVLTHPECRGRGFARQLMEHALAYLEARGVDWIKLDATDMGYPLYRKLGFEDEGPIERWGRPAELESPCASAARSPGFIPPLDREAFGADRGELLCLLAGIEAAMEPRGFAMGRPGSKAAYFGPCVSRGPDAARDLLAWYVSRHAREAIYWDLLPANEEAVRLAREFQFQPLRRLVRMARPGRAGAPPLDRDDSLVYAIAGFEYG